MVNDGRREDGAPNDFLPPAQKRSEQAFIRAFIGGEWVNVVDCLGYLVVLTGRLIQKADRPAGEEIREIDLLEPAFNLDKAKSFVRFTLLGAMGPAAGRRVERIEATRSAEELRVELDAIRDMLPKVLSKRQAELVWRQLEPIMLSLSQPPL